MLFRIFFIIFELNFLLSEGFAENCIDIANYSCFEERIEQICEVSAVWKGETVGKVNIKYPPYEATAAKKTVQSLLS